MPAPKLTFFCELDTGPLEALFADGTVIEHLRAMGAGVALGLVDLSAERAAVVRRLNEAGTPVIAWQLLPKEQGYWYNVNNFEHAAARYLAFKAWAAEHDLRFEWIGIDIEPDINEMSQAQKGDLPATLRKMAGRVFNPEPMRHAQQQYGALVREMQTDGFMVEHYDFGFMIDEHRTGSTLLQRLMGVVSPETDRAVPMVYASFMGVWGRALVWSYAPDVDALAVGSTGGGVVVDGAVSGDYNALDWPALQRDLLHAHHHGIDTIHVFSLEGCVKQGMLPQIAALDWNQPVPPPDADMLARLTWLRRGIRGVLWLSTQPALLTGVGLLALWWLVHPRRR